MAAKRNETDGTCGTDGTIGWGVGDCRSGGVRSGGVEEWGVEEWGVEEWGVEEWGVAPKWGFLIRC